jgi:hypothetical protein
MSMPAQYTRFEHEQIDPVTLYCVQAERSSHILHLRHPNAIVFWNDGFDDHLLRSIV